MCRVSAYDGRSELLFGREMIMNTRTLHADVSRDFPKAETVEASDTNPPLRRIQNGSRHIGHENVLYRSIDRRCINEKQWRPVGSRARAQEESHVLRGHFAMRAKSWKPGDLPRQGRTVC